MTVSDTMIHYWWAWIATVVVLVGSFLYGKRTEPGRKAWDWLKINTPIIGPMFRKVAITRSIRTLGTMISSGVSMLDALAAVVGSVRQLLLREVMAGECWMKSLAVSRFTKRLAAARCFRLCWCR